MPSADKPATGREIVVVDASAVLSLLIDPGTVGDRIAARLQDATLLAPALLPFEAANVLRRRRNAGLLSGAEAGLAHDELLGLPVHLWPWETVAVRAWELGGNLSSHDAAYVALAEQCDAALVTRDRRLPAAPGLRCRVEVF